MIIEELKHQLNGLSIEDQLRRLSSDFQGKIIFTTSLGIEDQLITHLIFKNDINIKVATLDTGRLFPQTYDLLSNTIIRYGKKIDIYFPDNEDVEKNGRRERTFQLL